VNSIQPCGGGKSTKRTSTPKKQTTPQKPNPIKTDKEIYSIVQPDICVICDVEKLDDKGCIGAPDWIIEIISQGNT
jgi:Uma2 family endonuclease